jgi:hypothetical protein
MRKWKFAIPAVLVLLIAVSYSFLPASVAADENNNDESMSGCPKIRGLDWKFPLPDKSKRIISVRWTAINDEDSGLVGYWAMDRFVRTFTVYLLPNGSYVAFSSYSGVFMTPQAALSPQKQTPEPQSGFGSLKGCLIAKFTATSMNTGTQLKGDLGVKDYKGITADILLGASGIGSPNKFDPAAYFFSGVSNYAEPKWGFVYTLDEFFEAAPSQVWINAISPPGNSGDIVV